MKLTDKCIQLHSLLCFSPDLSAPQMPPKRDEAALQEEEELQLAIALSQSEAEEKERMVRYLYAHAKSHTSIMAFCNR